MLLAVVHANSDLSAPLVMGDVAHRYDDAQLVTGRLGWWGGLWAVQLLRPLPGGLKLAGWLPLIATTAIAGAVAWQARRVWSDVSALVVALVALAAGQGTWIYNTAWSGRSPSWWAVGLMGLAAVRLAGATRRPDAVTIALGVAAVAAVAITGSGDQLAVLGGAAPLAVVAVVAAWRRRWAMAGAFAVGGAATWGLAVWVASLARSAGYLRQDFPVKLIGLDELDDAFDGVVEASRQLWASPLGIGRLAGDLGALLVAVALVAGAVVLVRSLRRRSGGDAPDADRSRDLQRSVWAAFWLTALAGYVVAFWLTTTGGLAGAASQRYLYGVPLAAAATLAPIGVLRRGRWAMGTAASVLALLTAGLFVAKEPKVLPIEQDLSRSALFSDIEALAAREHVTRGFASYWTAYPLALHSGRKLDVTPAGTCNINGTLEICAMYLHYVDQAYAPRPGIRSFLLVDHSALAAAGFSPSWVQRLPASMHPVKVVDIGDHLGMAIFDHDIAADIHPNAGQMDPRVGHGGPLEPQS